MGLFTGLLTLPLAPVRGVVWVADQVAQEAERQYYDPARIRQELEEVDEARRTGVIDSEEADRLEEELIARLMRERPRQ
jgi:hypothetical protein